MVAKCESLGADALRRMFGNERAGAAVRRHAPMIGDAGALSVLDLILTLTDLSRGGAWNLTLTLSQT